MIQKAVEILNACVRDDKLKKRAFLSAAMMKKLALLTNQEDGAVWEIAGLLCELDAARAVVPQLHGLKTVEMLKDKEFGDESIYNAIAAYNAYSGVEAQSVMQKALIVAGNAAKILTENEEIRHENGQTERIHSQLTCRMKQVGQAGVFAALCEILGIGQDEMIRYLTDI